jgi:hypothetical protein
MSSFCTSCGATYSGNSFCTSCGAVQNVVEPNSAEPTSVATPKVSEASDIGPVSAESAHESQLNDVTVTKSKKKLILVAVAVLVFLGSSSGAFVLGKSSVDLEKERKIGYDSGYDAGDSAGYSRGDSAGYSRGYTSGCENVYSFTDGLYDHLTPYNPSGYLYGKFPGSGYHSRSEC